MKGNTARKALWVGLAVGYVLVIAAPAAQAYLDPGLASIIFQAIVGGLLAVAVVVRSFGGRIWGFLTGRSRRRRLDRVTDQVD